MPCASLTDNLNLCANTKQYLRRKGELHASVVIHAVRAIVSCVPRRRHYLQGPFLSLRFPWSLVYPYSRYYQSENELLFTYSHSLSTLKEKSRQRKRNVCNKLRERLRAAVLSFDCKYKFSIFFTNL